MDGDDGRRLAGTMRHARNAYWKGRPQRVRVP